MLHKLRQLSSSTLVQIHFSVFFCFLSHLQGVFGIMWYVMWLLLAYGSPADHPTITEEERLYIEAAIGETVNQLSVTEVCQDNVD